MFRSAVFEDAQKDLAALDNVVQQDKDMSQLDMLTPINWQEIKEYFIKKFA